MRDECQQRRNYSLGFSERKISHHQLSKPALESHKHQHKLVRIEFVKVFIS